MADLNEEIAVLKAEIEGYKGKLNATTDPVMEKTYADLITSSRDNLTELLRQQTAGKFCSFFPFSTCY